MTNFKIPTREEVSLENQNIFDNLKKRIGFVPNLYATFGYSDSALGNYLQLQNGKTSLSKKEKEIVNLIVSQINGCEYCLSAHTAIGKMNGFSISEILEIRTGEYSSNEKYDALVKLAKAITKNKGRVDNPTIEYFLKVGYTKGQVIEVIVAIGGMSIMNYLHNLTKVDIDFPLAQKLETV